MTFRLAWILGFFLLTQTAAAAAVSPSPKLSCNLSGWKNVERFESLSEMRPEVVKFLLDRLASQTAAERSGLMAERDAPWQATDVADPNYPLPLRRFISGVRSGNRWFIWYERGGKSYSTHLVAYNFSPPAPSPILVSHLTPLLNDLCPVTRTLLSARVLSRGGLESGPW